VLSNRSMTLQDRFTRTPCSGS